MTLKIQDDGRMIYDMFLMKEGFKMGLYNKISNILLSGAKYIQHKDTDKLVNSILEIASFEKIDQLKPNKFDSVVFVTRFMFKHGGGLTSVLRIAKRLSERGINVYFTCPIDDRCAKMVSNAKINLPTYEANYILWNDALKMKFDFVITVQDTIMYYSRNLIGYQIYFVQDYEPFFNPIGDKYYLSKKAYELGEDIISLGDWNVRNIKRNSNVNYIGNIYSIDFPFEASEYPLTIRDYSNITLKKELTIAVYIKREPKRLPGIVMNLVNGLKEELEKKGITLNIYYFGLHKIEKPKYGINLGRITKKEIKALYEKSDFGMVASMTNISLVPYEMIACGLPVIEFMDGSYLDFLGDDTAILLESFSHQELTDKIISYIGRPELLNEMCIRARNKLINLSWDTSGKQFFDILESIAQSALKDKIG